MPKNLPKGWIIITALFYLTACEDKVENLNTSQKAQTKNNLEKVEKESLTIENAEPIAEVFFSTTADNAVAQTSFNCDDQVFAVIKFANQQPKLHQIEIRWKDPNSTEREKNSFPFFVTEKETYAWASLKLHRSVGAGMLQWINPAAGMEEFIGTWTVDVRVGKLLSKTLNFEVLC